MSEETPRVPEAAIDTMFLDRWSPRALSSVAIPESLVHSLFEAARWAPSCFNEQPWMFIYGVNEADLNRLRPLIVDQNRVWTDRAPLLAILFARRQFNHNGKANRHYMFDSGSAWMSLALQARKLGLYAHAMAGFHEAMCYSALGVSKEKFEAVCAIAVGAPGDKTLLPPALAEREFPNARKAPALVAMEGMYKE